MLRRYVIFLTVLLLFMNISPAFAEVDVVALERELMCYCDCNMVLSTCECEDAFVMRAEISDMAQSGMDKGAILAAFVNKYGESILTSPQARGFNLAAWIVPIVVIIAGAGILLLFVRQGRSNAVAVNMLNEDKHSNEHYDEMIEEKLKKYL